MPVADTPFRDNEIMAVGQNDSVIHNAFRVQIYTFFFSYTTFKEYSLKYSAK